MGYYVEGNGYLVIKKENLAAAHEALMALQDAPDKNKNGGAWAPGTGKTSSWYSWMPEDLRTLPDTQSVFETLGFEIEVSDNGDIVIGHYDSKIGQEEVFFAAAAPFIEDGEYEWIGEDSAFWTWEFNGGTMFRKEGYRSYGEAIQVVARS